MVEYVSLGDYHSAVGFLLASPPERSARYYRDALCTLALAHAAAAVPDTAAQRGRDGSGGAGGSVGGGNLGDAQSPKAAAAPQPPAASSLLWQAAKVSRDFRDSPCTLGPCLMFSGRLV